MGAVSPGRWQPWQFFTRMGATSLLNVTWGGLAILLGAAANRVARLAVNPKAIVFIALPFIIRVETRNGSHESGFHERHAGPKAVVAGWKPAPPPLVKE